MGFNIWQQIIAFVTLVLGSLLSLLPDVDSGVVSSIATNIESFKTYLGQTNWYFPVGTFFALMGIILTIEAGFFGFRIIHWIVKSVSGGIVK